MTRESRAKFRRLSLWFCLNFIIFLVCYLNYRLQLKHRYLYKTLSVGLCFSRAAAMVINFNLLLVWLPMCKYSLTRLAFLGTNNLRRLKGRLLELEVAQSTAINYQGQLNNIHLTNSGRFLLKLKSSFASSAWKLKRCFCLFKINFINSFLISVDHCKSLHTICATTITIASVTHTIAHLVNVINFSKNFDPLLSNLNMAEFKGQNPLQLLISVPGITGSLMIIILILMSLSSVDIIRYSSYDLFQIFHRLSVIFVILLFLHPASHVLKEQSNVDRHHPELCYSEMTRIFNSTSQLPNQALTRISNNRSSSLLPPITSEANKLAHYQGQFKFNATTVQSANYIIYNSNANNNNNKTTDLDDITASKAIAKAINQANGGEGIEKVDNGRSSLRKELEAVSVGRSEESLIARTGRPNRFCLDLKPLFVNQSSICWYVLCAGLSCYLFDLILRKWRRSKSSIELLDTRLDCEGNLIELILSNNHKRFSHWLPGQFVYLNCPQIAAYEWHPFTISSMDNRARQFTLHIKTGGDWTRKLRAKLECINSMSLLDQEQQQQRQRQSKGEIEILNIINFQQSFHLNKLILPNFDCYNTKTGQLQIECTKVSPIEHDNGLGYREEYGDEKLNSISESVTLSESQFSHPKQPQQQQQQSLNLFIDGPFHSPFERLLEQQVSVCIASGIGWTAFSSVFQCFTNQFTYLDRVDSGKSDWWNQWQNFAIRSNGAPKINKLSDTKLHLMVIVTSIEQLKPFYNLALNYFKQIYSNTTQMQFDVSPNQVREITAFITRCTRDDTTVKEFCIQENLSISNGGQSIRVNDEFAIYFGKPKFDLYLGAFSVIYSQKISVYCCGSHQVKKTVQEVCNDLNRKSKGKESTFYSYHEESF